MKLQHGSVIAVPDAPLQVVTEIHHGFVRAVPLGGSFHVYAPIFTDWTVVQEMLTTEQFDAMADETTFEVQTFAAPQ